MTIANEINGGRSVMISENSNFHLEGRCSIQLSYRRNYGNTSQRRRFVQARLCRDDVARKTTGQYYAAGLFEKRCRSFSLQFGAIRVEMQFVRHSPFRLRLATCTWRKKTW